MRFAKKKWKKPGLLSLLSEKEKTFLTSTCIQ